MTISAMENRPYSYPIQNEHTYLRVGRDICDFKMRVITHADIPGLMPLFEDHFNHGGKKYQTFDSKSMAILAAKWVDDPGTATVFVEDDKGPVGLGGVSLFNSPFNQNELMAAEIMWFVSPTVSKPVKIHIFKMIFDQLDQAVKALGVKVFKLCVPIESGVSRFLKRRGFEETEIILVRGK